MTSQQLRRFSAPTDFVPFAIHLADGRMIVIRFSEMVVLSGGGRIATVRNEEGADEVLDVLLITSLRPLVDRPTNNAG